MRLLLSRVQGTVGYRVGGVVAGAGWMIPTRARPRTG